MKEGIGEYPDEEKEANQPSRGTPIFAVVGITAWRPLW
jgi:hypothetical protein